MGGRVNPLALFVVAWPLAILAGFLSWHLVEKWFLRRKRRERNEIPVAPDHGAER
jgi:peptidoglycan/LPS O-acetylase OafA/YrhL